MNEALIDILKNVKKYDISNAWPGMMEEDPAGDYINISELKAAIASHSASTVTPVFDGGEVFCSECNHVMGYIPGPGGPFYYGPRCPGCGKLIDREVKR